ncbi:SMI1/KNR4 family protein [uncultured Winogradskyella sp.]|uniref:SMI1/KNR4 family protein n=1 Tax=uncultured Winogradskyella sp. TaxID=395353 RepID=UPI0026102442|nr:SMI1/KNR4 family protein [uncultured Winogradskyella sp.]
MTISTFNKLENTTSDFELLKRESEKKWKNLNLYTKVYGYQIQENSKWNKGLNEKELFDFQSELGFEFPECLKDFYRTMNGLNKQGINFRGGENIEPNFGSTFYSYPKDIAKIKEQIDWVRKDNKINQEQKAPNIFPFLGHRFLIIDNYEQVLSMVGRDIICWSEKLIKGIALDIFEFDHSKLPEKKYETDGFWNEKIL